MAFHDILFPLAIAVGGAIGPARPLEIVTARGGTERRNLPKADSRRRYEISVPPGDEVAQDALLHHWEGRRGGLYSFPVKNPLDHASAAPGVTPGASDQVLGTGDGARTQFQLLKTYEPGGPFPYARPITKPVIAGVVVSLNGTPQASGWSVARLTGIVTFSTPPGAGVVVRAGWAEHHDHVRYDGELLPATLHFGDGQGRLVTEYSGVNLIEVLGE